MVNAADARRRWFGLFCLGMAFAMLAWGQTVLKPYLDGLWFLLYWFVCFLFTVSSIFIALLDVRATRRRTRDEQRELIQRTLEDVDDKKERRTSRGED